ncbi:MAG: hypothetical protein HQL75_07265 [Magnetococcales bacterium]|nr:hypothetical protein [Magnetococcales bacterium]
MVTSDLGIVPVELVSKQQRYRGKQEKRLKQKALFLSERACEVLEIHSGPGMPSQSKIATILIEAAGELLERGNPVIWSGVVKKLRDRLV